MYAVRKTPPDTTLKPWELSEVISIHKTYAEASKACEILFNEGYKGVHVTDYSSVSTNPTN